MHKKIVVASVRIVVLIFLNLLVFTSAGSFAQDHNLPAFSPEEQAWLIDHPVIRLAPDPDFPPIEFIDKDGHYRGIAADFIQLLEKKLPLKFEIVSLKNWNEVIAQAKSRQIDLFGAAVPTPQRLKYMNLLHPMLNFLPLFLSAIQLMISQNCRS